MRLEWICQDRTGRDGTGQDRKGDDEREENGREGVRTGEELADRLGQNKAGQDKTRWDRAGRDRFNNAGSRSAVNLSLNAL